MDNPDNQTWCPSAPANRSEAVVLGVHAGPDGLDYLTAPVPAAEAVDLVPEGVEPTDIMRFAAHCSRQCGHHTGTGCGLVTKVVLAAPTADTALPRCHLRRHCQWWRQSGATACQRCPLVRTTGPEAEADELTRQVADPALGPEDLSLR